MHQSNQPFVTKLWNLFSSGKAKNQTFSPESIINSATKRSGVSDFGDKEFLEGLKAFLTSVEQTAGFHAFGRFYLRQLIIAMLVHRLKLIELLQAHPEILEQRINKPLFVLGLPRSGTTLLFNLLAQDLKHRFMFNWEAFIAQVPPKGDYSFSNDPRRKQAKWMLRFQKYMMPELDKLHEFSAAGSEECTPILMQSFATQALAGGFNAPTYSSWLDHADHDPTYRHHKRVLQALQWKYPGDRWLLKSPDHLSALDSLLKLYPDACFIHIHRDPAQSISSWASLNQVYRELYYPQIDTHQLGEQVLSRLANDLNRYMTIRATAPSNQFFDIQYHTFTKDPVSILRQAYDHFGFELTRDTQDRMLSYLEDNPENKHGVHNYKPEDFGLSEQVIRQRFEKYINRFLTPTEAQ